MKVTIDVTPRKLVAFVVVVALVAAGLAVVITWLALRGDEPPAVAEPPAEVDPPSCPACRGSGSAARARI